MKCFQKNPEKSWNLVCLLLLGVLLITQFLPFWRYGTGGETVSIASFVWMLTDSDAVGRYLSEGTGVTTTVNDVFAPAVFLMIAAIVGIILCLWKRDSGWVTGVPLLAGVLGIWQYLGKSAYRLGSGWEWHLILCLLLVAVAGWRFLIRVSTYIREKKSGSDE